MNNNSIIEFYLSGESLAATSRKFKISVYKIKKILEQKQVKIRSKREQNIFENIKRTKKINHNFFEELTPTAAYYLGFLAADGCVYQKRNLIKVTLSSIDKEFLEEFREALAAEREVVDSVTNKGFSISTFAFSSQKIKETLIHYDIKPNKTYLGVSMKNIPDELKMCWIKGFFDGDGCFTYNRKTKQSKITFTSKTESILKEIQWYLSCGNLYPKKGECYELDFTTSSANLLMEKFYSLNIPCLKRKKDKYLEYKALRG
jgi:hypothetical protein